MELLEEGDGWDWRSGAIDCQALPPEEDASDVAQSAAHSYVAELLDNCEALPPEADASDVAQSAAHSYVAELLDNCEAIASFFRLTTFDDAELGLSSADAGAGGLFGAAPPSGFPATDASAASALGGAALGAAPGVRLEPARRRPDLGDRISSLDSSNFGGGGGAASLAVSAAASAAIGGSGRSAEAGPSAKGQQSLLAAPSAPFASLGLGGTSAVAALRKASQGEPSLRSSKGSFTVRISGEPETSPHFAPMQAAPGGAGGSPTTPRPPWRPQSSKPQTIGRPIASIALTPVPPSPPSAPSPPPASDGRRRRPASAFGGARRCAGQSTPTTPKRPTPEIFKTIRRPHSASRGFHGRRRALSQIANHAVTVASAVAHLAVAANDHNSSPVASQKVHAQLVKPRPRFDNIRNQGDESNDEREKFKQTEHAKTLAEYFRESQMRYKDAGCDVENSLSLWQLHGVAKDVSMSVDDVRAIHAAFDAVDIDDSGRLDLSEFQEVVYKLLEFQLQDPKAARERAKNASEWYWWGSDTDQTGTISFSEFLKWYRSNGFKEDMLLSDKERRLRQLSKEYNISVAYLDRIRRAFDHYDADNSGSVDIEEFEQILQKVLKIPPDIQLPPKRVEYFWTQIDTDNSGKVAFEEFLQWWLKYFSEDRSKSQQIDQFYRGIRRIGEKYLDPPAYPPANVEIVPGPPLLEAEEEMYLESASASASASSAIVEVQKEVLAATQEERREDDDEEEEVTDEEEEEAMDEEVEEDDHEECQAA